MQPKFLPVNFFVYKNVITINNCSWCPTSEVSSTVIYILQFTILNFICFKTTLCNENIKSFLISLLFYNAFFDPFSKWLFKVLLYLDKRFDSSLKLLCWQLSFRSLCPRSVIPPLLKHRNVYQMGHYLSIFDAFLRFRFMIILLSLRLVYGFWIQKMLCYN